MKKYINPDKNEWKPLMKRPSEDNVMLYEIVKRIVDEVKIVGDEAVKKYTRQFDSFCPESFAVPQEEIDSAADKIPLPLKEAIDIAARNIEMFHRTQITKTTVAETMPGVKCWQKPVPIEKVGLYVPGGSAPLFSTVLMLGIPARIVGCEEIVICTPPGKSENINPAILYCASIVGATGVYKIGGAQAIAAMAYGTESVKKVYKIFGPGNQYVTTAKQIVNIDNTAIDMPAGPSEILVVADKSANPAFVAADLLSQAEHGADSQVMLVSSSEEVIDSCIAELNVQLEKLPRKEIAVKALHNSRAVVLNNIVDIVGFINEYAPEHLILAVKNDFEFAGKIVNAGSVFLGNYATESIGDYASGTNHTLPTYAWSKVYNGVNIDNFVKKITYQHVTEQGVLNIGPIVEIMAEAEELYAHKNAVTLRLDALKK